MKIFVNANPRASKLSKDSVTIMPYRKQSFPVRHFYLPPFPVWIAVLLLLGIPACHNPVNQKAVLGKWAIRKDSTEMNLQFTPDSVIISYSPEKTRFAYRYEWKQDKEDGLLECYQEVPLHSDEKERKVITSLFYIIRVSADTISVWVPGKKMRYNMKRVN
ncbi:MAG: hypothetical protein ACHQRM_01990 [Bacteroidia bacterium]